MTESKLDSYYDLFDVKAPDSLDFALLPVSNTARRASDAASGFGC